MHNTDQLQTGEIFSCPKLGLMRKLTCQFRQSENFLMHGQNTRLSNGQNTIRLEDDRICVFERNGVYQTRIRTSASGYVWRSLKTRNQAQAISAARRLFHAIEYRQQSGLPIGSRSVNRVIDEYVALRGTQHAQGHTTVHMLRQIRRVVKFWRSYIGDLSIEHVGNKELSGYIEWRKAYYAQFKTLPRNAKLNPADKTLQWEIMLGKAIVRWAQEQGHRGSQPLPTFSFTPKKMRVRPALELYDYRRLLRTLIKWQRDCPNETWLHARRLLTDYVLVLTNSGMRVGEAAGGASRPAGAGNSSYFVWSRRHHARRLMMAIKVSPRRGRARILGPTIQGLPRSYDEARCTSTCRVDRDHGGLCC